jgi:hypothetical protein
VTELRVESFRFAAGKPGATGFFYLFIDPGLVRESDLVHLCVEGRKNNRPALLALEQPAKVGAFAPSYSLQLAASYNASQDLRNRQKRPVGRVASSLSISRLQFSPAWARWYFCGDSVVSSDGKDKSPSPSAWNGAS